MKDWWKNLKPTYIGMSIGIMIILLAVLLGCNSPSDKMHSASLNEKPIASAMYYCPMDTEIVQAGPGVCPICKMDLVPKPITKGMPESGYMQPKDTTQVLIHPETKEMSLDIELTGYIAYDPSHIRTVSTTVAGRIEKLYVKASNEEVIKGEKLADIFSHELLTAQNEYLYVLKNETPESPLLKASRQKLLLLGMTKEQVNALHQGDHLHPVTAIYSPVSGFIFENLSSGSEASQPSGMRQMGVSNSPPIGNAKSGSILKEGSYVGKGEILFSIANTKEVWGVFQVLENQVKNLRKGQEVDILSDHSETPLHGKVTFIEPSFNQQAGRVRVILKNEKQLLKIGTFLKATVHAGLKKAMWVPLNAVRDLGKQKVVYVLANGMLEPRAIVTGSMSGQWVEVIKGINSDDLIANKVGFLEDSDASVQIQK